MSRIERRLWLFWFCLFAVTLGASALLAKFEGADLRTFPRAELADLRRSLRPERESKKIEKVASIEGITVIRIQTTVTNVRILRNEDRQDLSVTLEGRFLKSNPHPLVFEKADSFISLKVEEDSNRLRWTTAFDDGNSYSELTLVLPRQFSGRISIETVSGAVHLADLSLGEVDWKSVSGPFQSHGGKIHVIRLESVSGDVDAEGESLEVTMGLISGRAHFILQGLEHLTNPKVDLQSVSGAIDVAIPKMASLRISLLSFAGSMNSAVELKKSMRSGGALEGQMNGGAGEMRLRSTSGPLQLTTF